MKFRGEFVLKPEADIMQAVTDFIVNEVASAAPAVPPAPDDPIVESGLVDSLGLFKVIGFVEDTFGIKIAPEEILLENFATVRAIARLVLARQPG